MVLVVIFNNGLYYLFTFISIHEVKFDFRIFRLKLMLMMVLMLLLLLLYKLMPLQVGAAATALDAGTNTT